MGNTKEMLELLDEKCRQHADADSAMRTARCGVDAMTALIKRQADKRKESANKVYCAKVQQITKSTAERVEGIDRTALTAFAIEASKTANALKVQLEGAYALHNISHEEMCNILGDFTGDKYKVLAITGKPEMSQVCGMMSPAGLVMVNGDDPNFDKDVYYKSKSGKIENTSTLKVLYSCLTTHPNQEHVLNKWDWWKFYIYARVRANGPDIDCSTSNISFGDFYKDNKKFAGIISSAIEQAMENGYFDCQDNLDAQENTLND